jgi:hypothetical protein
MNRDEVIDLFTAIAIYDRRTVGGPDVEAWLHQLGDLDFEQCLAAVHEYFRSSTGWLMPATVRDLVRAKRERAAHRRQLAALATARPGPEVHERGSALVRQVLDPVGAHPEAALAVACPHCHAPIGAHCTRAGRSDRHRVLLPKPHPSRLDAARAADSAAATPAGPEQVGDTGRRLANGHRASQSRASFADLVNRLATTKDMRNA